jgi:predicted dehydrogenase
VEYTAPGVAIATVDAYLRRHPETGAVVSASGVLRFDDGSTSTWNCGFDSGAGVQDLRISGTKAVIKLDDFLRSRRDDHTGVYEFRSGWDERKQVEVPSARPGERTQQWLDAVWESALGNEVRN